MKNDVSSLVFLLSPVRGRGWVRGEQGLNPSTTSARSSSADGRASPRVRAVPALIASV